MIYSFFFYILRNTSFNIICNDIADVCYVLAYLSLVYLLSIDVLSITGYIVFLLSVDLLAFSVAVSVVLWFSWIAVSFPINTFWIIIPANGILYLNPANFDYMWLDALWIAQKTSYVHTFAVRFRLPIDLLC